MIKCLNLMILGLVASYIVFPRVLCFAGLLGVNTDISFELLADQKTEQTDDRSEEDTKSGKGEFVDLYYIPASFEISIELSSISFYEIPVTFKSTYIPEFHVPPPFYFS